jgi:hypothetical protein
MNKNGNGIKQPHRTLGKEVVVLTGKRGRPKVAEVVGNVFKKSAHKFLSPEDRVCVVRHRDGSLGAYASPQVVMK